jgi:hypothetical protein
MRRRSSSALLFAVLTTATSARRVLTSFHSHASRIERGRMRLSARVVLAVFILVIASSVWVYTQAQNALAKYGSGGALTGSTLYDNDGVLTWGPSGSEAGRITYNSSYFYVEARGGRALNLSNGRVVVKDNGRVGIGTADPGAQLSLGNAFSHAKFAVYDGGGSLFGFGVQPNEFRFHVANNGNDLRFYDAPEGNALFTVKGGGNVGIGTISPTAKLHVNGNVVVEGNIGAKYQDVAEWVDSTEAIEPGTVVIADPDRANHVRSSTQKYDTAVAGVVSSQPGILLGEEGRGKIAVAQSGRVRVKVDAGFGAIKPGDLLVTSPVEGYAMRSAPIIVGEASMHRPGTILGKALEPLATGRGEILVLVTLQ